MLIRKLICSMLACAFALTIVSGQSSEQKIISEQELRTLIDTIGKVVHTKYIDEQIGHDMSRYLQKQLTAGVYHNLSYKQLGKKLREDFYHISQDRHMNAFYSEKSVTQQEIRLKTKLDKWGSLTNCGHTKIEIDSNNIGHLRIAHFTNWDFFEEAKKAVDRSMFTLKSCDALVIDVRDNPGGFEDIVAYLVSYFIEDKSKPLQEYYCRFEDRSRQVKTAEDLPGQRLAKTPVYILVDRNTGSAGESFAYIMKHLNRATVIGDTTVGAGNGSTFFRVNNEFAVQVATWETINKVTQKSWEKVGVIPNIVTSSESAMDKAYGLALKAAQQIAQAKSEHLESLSQELGLLIEASNPENKDKILELITACQELGLYDEYQINRLGYECLSLNKVYAAMAIFKANTLLYPNSANVYDSYGESLEKLGQIFEAHSSYRRALEIGKINQNPNLSIFEENVERTRPKG